MDPAARAQTVRVVRTHLYCMSEPESQMYIETGLITKYKQRKRQREGGAGYPAIEIGHLAPGEMDPAACAQTVR